jgi:hypothetical protein
LSGLFPLGLAALLFFYLIDESIAVEIAGIAALRETSPEGAGKDPVVLPVDPAVPVQILGFGAPQPLLQRGKARKAATWNCTAQVCVREAAAGLARLLAAGQTSTLTLSQGFPVDLKVPLVSPTVPVQILGPPALQPLVESGRDRRGGLSPRG